MIIESMITSKEVFAKRKEGLPEEAYQMAIELMKKPVPDEWDIKAYAWCVIDLIKRDVTAGNRDYLEYFKQQLELLKINASDKILNDQRSIAINLCNPNSHLILRAKSLSKSEQYHEAVNLYKSILESGERSIEVQTNLAWDLYHLSKLMLSETSPNFKAVKHYLNDYLNLQVERPSLIHTCFLELADKIPQEGNLQMGGFVRLWGLDNLREEDREPYETPDGLMLPSLAEKVILHASKDAVLRGSEQDLVYILPYLDNSISHFPDNLWLKLNKAKVLLSLGRNDEACKFGIEVVKNKSNDFWSWDLLLTML